MVDNHDAVDDALANRLQRLAARRAGFPAVKDAGYW